MRRSISTIAATSTLGLIDNLQNGFAGGLGFGFMEFSVIADGKNILDVTIGKLSRSPRASSTTPFSILACIPALWSI